MNNYILVINPGSTSTKLAIFNGEKEALLKTLRHLPSELEGFHRIIEQADFRKAIILEFLKESKLELSDFRAVIGRGGLVKPIPGGIYEVDAKMLEDLRSGKYGDHASNLGAVLAWDLSDNGRIPAFMADPVVVDEMSEMAKYTGFPSFTRRSIFHALNQKAVARLAAAGLGEEYENVNLIVVHMGGGISIGAHQKGRVIDVNNALDGDGPFSPERSGTLPVTQLVDLCFSEGMTLEIMKKKLKGNGGLVAHLGTNDAMDVQKRIKAGDEKAKLIYSAMIYQVGKSVGKCAAVLQGKVDAIILTGGLAYDTNFVVNPLKEMISFIAPILVFPGGDEEKALASATFRVLKGYEEAKKYSESIYER